MNESLNEFKLIRVLEPQVPRSWILPAFFVFLSFLSPQQVSANSKGEVMESWFKNKNCRKLELIRYNSISDKTITGSVKIEDAKVIADFISRIEKIPPAGSEMVSFGPNAERIDLVFNCEKENQTIEIFQKLFKTPSNAFHSSKDPNQEQLYRDVDALLSPDYKKTILKVENLELKFDDFTLTYKGEQQENGGPTTLNFTSETYIIKDKKLNEQTIKITSGQSSPAPAKFKIPGSKLFLFSSTFTLLTYESDSNERLYPKYFQIRE